MRRDLIALSGASVAGSEARANRGLNFRKTRWAILLRPCNMNLLAATRSLADAGAPPPISDGCLPNDIHDGGQGSASESVRTGAGRTYRNRCGLGLPI